MVRVGHASKTFSSVAQPQLVPLRVALRSEETDKKMTKPPTKREIEKTFDFVLDELIRHIELSQDVEKFKRCIKEDGWHYELPFPDGQRLIGKDAYRRLASLARAIVATDDRLIGRVRVETFFRILSEELGRAISEREEVEEKKFIEHCVDLVVSKHCSPRDFYIPCIAPYFQGMTKFQIGSVTFFDKPHFFAENSGKIQAFGTLEFGEFEDFYKIQNWIAHVRIDGFDPKCAEERAFLCVRLAIASIKAKLDSGLAQWLGTEKQSMPGLTRYSLTSEPEGENPQSIQLGWGRQFILNSSNERVEHLLSPASRTWFAVFGAFLEQIACVGRWSYLETKIVTALVWLDIGNSPISDAEKVVAFSNCLEALFVTKERGKKQQLAMRSRYLLEYSGWRSDLNDKVEGFYSSRGGIVHGDIMPLASELSEVANLGKYLADVSIEGFIHFSHWLLAKHDRAGTKEHELPFNGRGSFDRAMEQELPAFIQELREWRAAVG